MAYDADELQKTHYQFRLLRLPASQERVGDYQVIPQIKMQIGDWYEFGNRTREIKACESRSSARLRTASSKR
jgi:hypothetical protein